jgi:hypothetical protein
MLDVVLDRIGVFKRKEDLAGETYKVVDLGEDLENAIDCYQTSGVLFEGPLEECLVVYRSLILIMEWCYEWGHEAGSNEMTAFYKSLHREAKAS